VNPSVTICIPAKDHIESECLESALNQDYDNFEVMIHIMKPKEKVDDPVRSKSVNSTHNRNAARRKLLASESEFFLFVDSDTVLPRGTISKLVRHKKDIVGGWYATVDGRKWVAGCWGPDGVFHHYKGPEKSLVRTDMVGLGCVLLSRKAMERITFHHGTDKTGKDPNGKRFVFLGPCAQFGLDALAAGIPAYIDGDVVCKHVERCRIPVPRFQTGA